MHHFIGGQRQKRLVDHLLTIKQGEKEPMRSYVKCFTREALEVDKAYDKVQLSTFKAGLKSREFVVALAKNLPKTMAEMLLKAQKYMNVEDVLVAIMEESRPKGKESVRKNQKGRKRERNDSQTNSNGNKQRDDKIPRTVKFTPLMIPVDKILAQIKEEHHLKWPKPLHSSPNVRDKRKNCCFHKDHDHYTEDCRDLKEQIEELIRKGKLQKFVKKGKSGQFKDDRKEKSKNPPIDEDKSYNHLQSMI
ncbi:uncharacterized protein LOC112001560 [Quercus suber]|uniref:uncharacterized protein LOC112001560 n=1 Tax=Quercus suber TaxID=58331 RepID=UPI0032DF728C